jgi:hypothetical protein
MSTPSARLPRQSAPANRCNESNPSSTWPHPYVCTRSGIARGALFHGHRCQIYMVQDQVRGHLPCHRPRLRHARLGVECPWSRNPARAHDDWPGTGGIGPTATQRWAPDYRRRTTRSGLSIDSRPGPALGGSSGAAAPGPTKLGAQFFI